MTDLYTIQENGKSQRQSPKFAQISPARGSIHRGPLDPKNTNPLADDSYLRRLKAANYGKWYLTPKEYNRKVDLVNEELNKVKELQRSD